MTKHHKNYAMPDAMLHTSGGSSSCYVASSEAAASEMLKRATNPYGVSVGALAGRVQQSIEKHLLKHEPNATQLQVQRFIESLAVDDLCLALACEAGEAAAWQELMEKYTATVCAAARIAAGNEADELAANIWAELHGWRERKGKLTYYSGCGSLGGFLRAVVAQMATDEHRRAQRFVSYESEVELDLQALSRRATHEALASLVNQQSGQTPEATLEKQERAHIVEQALRAAIEKLAAEDSLLLQLYYFDNLSLKEAGAVLGFHEATASRRIARIQKDLSVAMHNQLEKLKGWTQDDVRAALIDFQTTIDFETLVRVSNTNQTRGSPD